MVDHVLIRPFPYAGEDRLVKLYEDHSLAGGSLARRIGARWDAAPANYRDWKRLATSFEGMGMYRGLVVSLFSEGERQHVEGASIAADLFPVLGAKPMVGRVLRLTTIATRRRAR